MDRKIRIFSLGRKNNILIQNKKGTVYLIIIKIIRLVVHRFEF